MSLLRVNSSPDAVFKPIALSLSATLSTWGVTQSFNISPAIRLVEFSAASFLLFSPFTLPLFACPVVVPPKEVHLFPAFEMKYPFASICFLRESKAALVRPIQPLSLHCVVTNENFIDASAGYTFKPSNVITDPRNNTYFISEGKIIGYTEGLLYRPAQHPKEYHWNYPIAYSGVTQCGLFFDEISRKYYFVTTQEDDPEAGIVGDSYALDKVIDFEDNRNFKDEAIIGYSTSSMYAPDNSSASNIATVVSAENGKIHLNEFTYFTDYTDYSESRKCTSHEELAMADANIHTKAVLANKTWYFSSDNKIYSTPEILPKIEPFIDIPTQYGKVVNLSTSVMGSRLIVTTYDENSPEKMKGSILIIDIQSKEIIPHPHYPQMCPHFQC